MRNTPSSPVSNGTGPSVSVCSALGRRSTQRCQNDPATGAGGVNRAATVETSIAIQVTLDLPGLMLYGGSILLDILYNLATGNPLNYLFIGFGLLLVWQILKFRNRLELA